MDLMDLLKNKGDVIKFLLETIDSNDKMSAGLRKITESQNTDLKTNKLLEVVANQSIQIKHLSLLLLIYSQGSSFDKDVAIMMNKMGRGEEVLKQMLRNKMSGF